MRSFPPEPGGNWYTGFCFDISDPDVFYRFENSDRFGFKIRAYKGTSHPWLLPPQWGAGPQPIGQILIAIPFGWLAILFGCYPIACLIGHARIRNYVRNVESKSIAIEHHQNACMRNRYNRTLLSKIIRNFSGFAVILCLTLSVTICGIMAAYYFRTSGSYTSLYLFRTGTDDPTDSVSFWLQRSLIGDPRLYFEVSSYSEHPRGWENLLVVIPKRYVKQAEDGFRRYTDGSTEYVTRFRAEVPIDDGLSISILYIAACVGWFWAGRRIRRTDRCLRCQYNLTGNQSGVCPECGLICAAGLLVATDD